MSKNCDITGDTFFQVKVHFGYPIFQVFMDQFFPTENGSLIVKPCSDLAQMSLMIKVYLP